jgi:hypothetical protein
MLVLFFLLTAFAANSQSQEPPPSGAETGKQEQSHAAETNQPASADNKPSAQQPIIVHVEPARKTEAEAEEDRHERKEKAELDRRLVDLTAELSTYTGGLYSATVILAIATVALVIATVGLVIMAVLQSRDMKASVDLARAEFVATHRPRVIVRLIQEPWYETGSMIRKAWVTVVNVGVNPAILEEFGGDIAYRNRYGWLPPGLDASPKEIASVTLLSGQRHRFTVSAKLPYTDNDAFYVATGDRSTHIVGSLKYLDGQGVVRETAFSRTYDELAETFSISEDPEEEYQD